MLILHGMKKSYKASHSETLAQYEIRKYSLGWLQTDQPLVNIQGQFKHCGILAIIFFI